MPFLVGSPNAINFDADDIPSNTSKNESQQLAPSRAIEVRYGRNNYLKFAWARANRNYNIATCAFTSTLPHPHTRKQHCRKCRRACVQVAGTRTNFCNCEFRKTFSIFQSFKLWQTLVACGYVCVCSSKWLLPKAANRQLSFVGW